MSNKFSWFDSTAAVNAIIFLAAIAVMGSFAALILSFILTA